MKNAGSKTTEKVAVKEGFLVFWASAYIPHFFLLTTFLIVHCGKKNKVATERKYTISKEEAARIVSKGTGYPLSVDFSIKEGELPLDFAWRYEIRNREDYFRALQGLDSAGYIKVSGISDSSSKQVGPIFIELTNKGKEYFKRREDSLWKAELCKMDVLEVESLFIDTFYLRQQKMATALVFYTFGYSNFAPFFNIVKPIFSLRNVKVDSVCNYRARLYTYEHGWRVHYGIR